MFNATGYDADGNHWSHYGDCQDPAAPNMFPADNDEEAVGRALNECDGCPVKDICLITALDNAERFGVWGGTTPSQRMYKIKYMKSRVVLVKAP